MSRNNNLEELSQKQSKGEPERPSEADKALVEAFLPLMEAGFPEDDVVELVFLTDGKEEALKFAKTLRERNPQTRQDVWKIAGELFPPDD